MSKEFFLCSISPIAQEQIHTAIVYIAVILKYRVPSHLRLPESTRKVASTSFSPQPAVSVLKLGRKEPVTTITVNDPHPSPSRSPCRSGQGFASNLFRYHCKDSP